MSRILGIDPGNEKSGWVIWDGQKMLECGVDGNGELMSHFWLTDRNPDAIAIEMIGHYGTGMAVGKTVFHTCIFIGRFYERCQRRLGITPRLVLRPSIKADICGTPRAKDGNVIQALKDQIGEKGTKNNQGPLYGIKSHAWQALALAVALDRGRVKTVDL